MSQTGQPAKRQNPTAPQPGPRPTITDKGAGADTGRMLQLIEAAEDIFLAKGYHSATMNDVAKAAGMSKKTVYQLVDSKAELLAALLSHHQSLLSFPERQSGWTVRDSLVQNLLCLAKFLLSPQQIALVRLIMAEHTHNPDLARIFHKQRVLKARNRLESCLMEAAFCGDRKVEEAREMSAMLFGMACGEFYLGVLIGFRQMPTRSVLERRIADAVDICLEGFAAR